MVTSGYCSQIKFRLPSAEQGRFELRVLRSCEIGIPLGQPRRFLPGLIQDLGVPDEIAHPQIGGAPLPGPEKLARPADAQVLLGDQEPTVTLDHPLKAASRLS